MPIYEFYCEKCKEKIEILCKLDERDVQKCKKCKKKLKQVISKGVGFKINGASFANGYTCDN